MATAMDTSRPDWNWKSDLKRGEIRVIVEKAEPKKVTLRLEGEVEVEQREEGGLQATYFGRLEYAPDRKIMTRFDVVAVGGVRALPGGRFYLGHRNPPGQPNPWGWAFELGSWDNWIDRQAPYGDRDDPGGW